MARQEFPLSINRRRLLVSAAAAVTSARIVPGLESASRRSGIFPILPTDAQSRTSEFLRRNG